MSNGEEKVITAGSLLQGSSDSEQPEGKDAKKTITAGDLLKKKDDLDPESLSTYRGGLREKPKEEPVVADETIRADGTKKGKGFLGELKRPDGDVSTEISIGVPINGKETEIPTLVPTLTEPEKQYLLNTPSDKIFEADPKIYKGIHEKAVAHAESRIAEGKSPFADEIPIPPIAPGKDTEEYITYKPKPQPEKYVPSSTEYQMYRASAEGDMATSDKITTDVLQKKPDDPYANRIAYYNAKKAGTATPEQLEKAMNLNPDDVSLLTDYAANKIQAGDDQAAMAVSLKILQNIPEDTKDLQLLAHKSHALTVIAATIQKTDPTKVREFVVEKMAVDDQIDAIKASQEPPTSMEYVMSKGINNSMIGMVLRGGLPVGSTDQEYDRFKDYKPTFGEDVAANIMSVFTDLPLFAVGGAGGAAVGELGINLTTKLLLNQARKEILKRGLSKEATDLLLKQVAGKVAESGWITAANVASTMAETSQALGVYSAMTNAARQVVNDGKSIDKINYEDVLNEYMEQSIIGAAVGGIGYGTGAYNRALTKGIEESLGKGMTQAAKAGKTVLVHGGGFVAENAAFIYGGKALRGEPISATGEEWAASMITLGALKGYGLVKGLLKDGYVKSEFIPGPEDPNKPSIVFSKEELGVMGETANGMGLIEGLRTNPEKLAEIIRNPEVPLTAKLKILWGLEGARPQDMPRVDKIVVDDQFKMKVYREDGTLIFIKDFESKEQADEATMNIYANIKDRNEQEFSQSLDAQLKQQVVENLKARGFDFELKVKASETLPADRTAEETAAMQQFNVEVQKVFAEEQTRQQAEIDKKGLKAPGEQKPEEVITPPTVVEKPQVEPIKPPTDVKKEETQEPAGTPEGTETKAKEKEEVVAEINSLPLTHVEGQGMDAGAGKGTYLSTEPGNRYATDKAPAKPATVNIKNPFVIEGIDHMIEEAQRRGIKKGADTRKMRDNLIAALEKEGHDAVYFKESGSQEGELYVMDRKNVVTEKPAPVYTTQSGIDIRNDGGELTMVDAEGKEIPATLDRTRKNKPVKGKQRPDTKYKVKNPKYQEAIDEYAKVADLDIGESAFKEAEEVPTDIDRASVIADKSNNPREIAEAFVSERDLNPFNQGDPKEEAINKHIRYVVGGSAQGEGFNSPGSFVNNSDISNVTPGMTLKWFRKDGQTLDQVADYANGEFGGEEIVTPKDVADFIIKYPSRDFEKSKENPNLEKLRIRFEEITGLPLDDVMVNRIERDRAAKMEDMPIDTDVDSKLPQHIKERIDEGGITLENVNDVADLLGWEGEIKDNVLKYLQNEQARRQAEFDSSQEGEDIPGQGEQMEGEPEAEPAPERKPGKLEKEYNDKIKSLDRELAAEKKRNTWLKNNIAKQKTKQGEMFGEEKPEAPPEGMFEEGVAKDFSKENVERMLEDSNGKLRKLQEDRLNLEGKRDQAREADESQGDLFEDKAQSFDDWLNSFKRTKPLKDETDTMGISDDKLWNDFIDAIRELIKSAKKLKTKAEEIFNKIEGLISEFRNSDLYMNATPKERSKADRDINDIRDRVVEEVNAMQKEAKAGGAESFDENIASRLKEIGDMNPMEFPEIVRLATELGAAIRAKKLSPNIRGKFVVNGKEIDLSYDLFKEGNEVQLAKTLAHEIGHLVDFIPDETMSRGNILGRIASLHHFLKTYLPFKKGDLGALTKEDIDRFKEEAKKVTDQVVEKEIDEEIVTTTGLTPEDVLAVWNTATGSGIKTLEDFVKGLNAQQMKSIIKQAFKGNIADELKHLITEKRTKTGKKIKITEIIKGDWKQKLKSLIIEEIKKRKLWDENVIYDELYEFSKKWRPFDEVRSPASFVKYRKSSKEIYADAISGLLNSPGTLLADAPHFYNAFFNYIAEKPEFAEAYLNLMDMVRDPLAVNEARLADMYEGFNEAIEKLRANILDKAKFPKLNPWNNFVQNFISDVAVGIKGLPRTNDFGVVLSPKHKVRNSIEMMRLVDNEVYVMAEQFRNEIWGALEKVGVSSNDFDAILTTERQLADRLEKANPLGWQGQTNQDMKDFIYSKFTPEQAKVVDQVKQRFHEIVWGYVERLYKEGGYTEKAWKESIEPFKDTYATYWIVDYIEKNYISAGLIQVTGTLKKHASPSLATAVKMASVIRLTAMQRAKNNLITELKKSDPDNIKDGIPRKDKFGKKTGEFKDVPGMKPIFYYNEGVWSAVQVDPWVAEVFEKLPPQDLDVITSIAREFNQIFKPVVTKYNPGFAFVTNIVRDYKQSTAAIYSIMQANKSTRNRIGDLFYIPLRTIAGYPQSIYQGSKLLRGNRAGEEKTKLTRFLSKHFYDQKLIDEMIRVGAFSVKTAILNNYDPVESQNDAVLFSKFGFGVYKLSGWEAMRKRNQFFNFLGTVLDGYETAAGGIEVASKINSYKVLKTRIKDAEALGFYVRNFTGTPNFNEKAKKTIYTNNYFPFSNVIAQGLRTVAELATSPNTAGAYWMYKTLWAILPAILSGLAESGAFGDELKKALGRIGSYFNFNYMTIPLGQTEDGKEAFIAIPQDEVSRILYGIARNATMAIADNENYDVADLRQLLQIGAGMTPSISPLASITGAWFDFAVMGGNPYDRYYGGAVVPRTEFEAGGWAATRPMVDWTLKTAGLRDIVKMYSYDPMTNSTAEFSIMDLPALNRAIRYSDRGVWEQYNKEIKNNDKDDARKILEEEKVIGDKVVKLNAKDYKVVNFNSDALEKYKKEVFPDGIRTNSELELWNSLVKKLSLVIEMRNEIFPNGLRSMDDLERWNKIVKKFSVTVLKGTISPDAVTIKMLINKKSHADRIDILRMYKKNNGIDKTNDLIVFMGKNGIISEDLLVAIKQDLK